MAASYVKTERSYQLTFSQIPTAVHNSTCCVQFGIRWMIISPSPLPLAICPGDGKAFASSRPLASHQDHLHDGNYRHSAWRPPFAPGLLARRLSQKVSIYQQPSALAQRSCSCVCAVGIVSLTSVFACLFRRGK